MAALRAMERLRLTWLTDQGVAVRQVEEAEALQAELCRLVQSEMRPGRGDRQPDDD
ncbi:hypothetical protein FMEAI12_3350016 [Parafrankia sp. Ea1.12]|nr:hypothetical protein FMEAI12_3350016 [Parafrankia sp. Ea1.12]